MPPREAATKYNKAEHLTLRDRFARLNTHSIAKKTTRLSRLFMHEAGIVAKVGSPHPTTCGPTASPRVISGPFCCLPSRAEVANADTRWPMLSREPQSHF